MADSQIHVALAGNPNCGKTTLFNLITGANGYVGNWPGVTVEKKEAKLLSDKNVTITDLPGIYSLSPYSPEEQCSRDYLMSGEPDVVVQVVDATNLERNLYLALQVIETGLWSSPSTWPTWSRRTAIRSTRTSSPRSSVARS